MLESLTAPVAIGGLASPQTACSPTTQEHRLGAATAPSHRLRFHFSPRCSEAASWPELGAKPHPDRELWTEDLVLPPADKQLPNHQNKYQEMLNGLPHNQLSVGVTASCCQEGSPHQH